MLSNQPPIRWSWCLVHTSQGLHTSIQVHESAVRAPSTVDVCYMARCTKLTQQADTDCRTVYNLATHHGAPEAAASKLARQVVRHALKAA
eukprot:357656-Chlamydomonas_euryale.AAC.1